MDEELTATNLEQQPQPQTMHYHPGIEQGIDFIYGSDQSQYLEQASDEQE